MAQYGQKCLGLSEHSFTLIRSQVFVIAAGVAPNPADICRGFDPVERPDPVVLQHLLSRGMCVHLQLECYIRSLEAPRPAPPPPATHPDQSSSGKIEENEVHLTAGPADLTRVKRRGSESV